MTNDTMSGNTTTSDTATWVAVGPAGAVGAIHRAADGFRVELYGVRAGRGGTYPSLETAKGAVHKALGPLASRPEFHAH
ncbi:methyltransferase [Curtobacterium sp. VKM Ac-2865]|uniref:methyltransferase n=1 Tax=Curtobacterium sp. VKM Ac-2865 TaxID=2783817 RepID=UPI001E629BE3|nr:methyltransferase [Curtobacterium sp. VKM Ac-2865]